MTMWVIYEKKKILAEGGFEPQISGHECKMLPLSYEELLQRSTKKSLQINAPSDTVLAIFSQFPPLSANFHLYSTNLDLLPHLLYLYDMSVVERGLFPNQPFGSYLLNRWANQ